MKKYSVYALKVVKIQTSNNIHYLICQYDEFTNTYIEILTNEKFKISDNNYVEPLSNYYSILEQRNYKTGKPLMLDKKMILKKYIDINIKLNSNKELRTSKCLKKDTNSIK